MPRHHLCFAKSNVRVLILILPSIFNVWLFTISSILRDAYLTPCSCGFSDFFYQHFLFYPASEGWRSLRALDWSLFPSHCSLINCHDSEHFIYADVTYISIYGLTFPLEFQATVISSTLTTGLPASTLSPLNHFSIVLFSKVHQARLLHCPKSFNDFMLNYG